MKRPLQLPLAIALALGGTNAFALGLGPVHVHSKLNQPLDAEIPVIQGSAGEAEGLLVNLAAAEDFERVGLSRARLGVPLDFAVARNGKGEVVIKVTSKDPVRETYLDFLVEANWPKGRLLREYTVLLDPPTTAPATRSAATPTPAAPGTVTIARREPPPERAAPVAPPTPKAAAPKPAPAAPVAKSAKDGEYGPIEAGETLSGIARSVRADGNINQTMLALLKANPNAFYKDNINALKRGAILRIPSADEMKAAGSASEAAAQVQSQIEDWRGGRASPTLVADAGGKPAPAATAASPSKKPAATAGTSAASSERLELVPPKAGKDSMAMAERPGSGAGSPAATELKSELARTKEALTSRDQETGELRSRVKELEDLKSKNDRLIGLKDSEIAELQQKLKQLQDKPGSTPAKSAATAATATPPAAGDKIAKQDIWGNDSGTKPATGDAAKTPASSPASSTSVAPTAATATVAATPSGTSSTPAPGTPSSSAATPSTANGSASTPSSTPSSSTPPAPTSTSASTTPASTTPASVASTPSSSTATPSASTPPGTTPTSGTTPPVTTATPPANTASTAATPAVTAKPRPAVAPKPAAGEWYDEPWFKPAAIGAGVLVLLLALLGLRKRSPKAAVVSERGSLADSFGDSPLGIGAGAAAASASEEAQLQEQLRIDPHNVGLHLELLSLYYADREISKFESAAADMHAYVSDPHQPEWLEAQAMGRELAPENPLFAEYAHYAHDDVDELDEDRAAALAHAESQRSFLLDDERNDPVHPTHAVDHAFDLDPHFGEPPAAPAAPTHANPPKHDESFDFDLPPLGFDPPPAHTPAAHHPVLDEPVIHDPIDPPAAPARVADDDFYQGDDAIGTKLDLAKAYMDMGDPEGARSMLDEVISEGSEAQKAEARRLMAEVR